MKKYIKIKITSPDGFLPSFKREVIYKQPEVFKVKALREIKNLFPSTRPFIAGFGNKDTVNYFKIYLLINLL